MTKALGYLRTSSVANVGGDSETRQRAAIERHAAANGIVIVEWFYDAAVSGADPVQDRDGFAAMLDRIDDNGVRLVLVEDASRFARCLMAQELGVVLMQQRGVKVITANGEDLTETDDPSRIMMRQIGGAFAQYEKARLVGKLRAARDRKSEKTGKRIEGRKAGNGIYQPVYAAIRTLVAANPAMSLQAIGNALTAQGLIAMVGKKEDKRPGKPFTTTQVGRFIETMGLDRVDGRSKAARAA
jgi:DNA invertase Pin-like site-specific DNA recombinase